MIELGIERCKSIRELKVSCSAPLCWSLGPILCRNLNQDSMSLQTSGCALGSKPCLLFAGDLFETDSQYSRLKNLLTGQPLL